MKKLITLLVVVLFAFAAKAQLNNWYVGGIVGFSSIGSENNNNQSTMSWAFGPEVGVGIGENWSAGLVLGLNGSKVSNDNGDISSTFVMMPDIYGRRWWEVGERLNFFAGLDVTFGTGTTTMYDVPTPGTDQETDMSSFGTNLNGGIAYSLAERWTLLFKLAGVGFDSVDDGNGTDNNFWVLADGNVMNGNFLFIGIYWTFLPGNK